MRYKLFGIGKLPADMREAIEREGALHVHEGVPVAYRFSGKLPGLVVNGTNTRTYSGALALSKKRALATLSVIPKVAGRALDHEWGAGSTGALKVAFDAHGLHLDVNLSDVDPEWTGEVSLQYELELTQAELDELPVKSFAVDVPHEWILKLAGLPT